MEFLRQEYWSGLPFPSPEGLSDPGMEAVSPALAGGFFTTEHLGNPCLSVIMLKMYDRMRAEWEHMMVSEIGVTSSCISSVQFSRSVVSDSLGPHESQHTRLPVHHKLQEFTQTHAHRVGDAIQPSHPLSSPSSPAPNPSQHQGLF